MCVYHLPTAERRGATDAFTQTAFGGECVCLDKTQTVSFLFLCAFCLLNEGEVFGARLLFFPAMIEFCLCVHA